MKATLPLLILASEQSWWLVAAEESSTRKIPIQIDADSEPRDLAAALKHALEANGYAGGPVVLALPASLCFTASIDKRDLPRGDGNALRFRLEEKLPFAAESVVADFVEVGDSALGVCCKRDWLEPRVAAMEAADIDIQWIAPATLLAAQALGSSEEFLLVL